MHDMGLRERNKIKRHAAIVAAALELFAERGYAATTIADIAEAAEIAPRTVSLYFPTKQDIALASVTDLTEGIADALRARPPGASIIDAIAGWLRAELARSNVHQLELIGRMFAANPELRALHTARMEIVVADGVRAIADELGVEPDDPRTRIALAAMGAIIEYILTTPSARASDEAIDVAVSFLRSGFASLRSA